MYVKKYNSYFLLIKIEKQLILKKTTLCGFGMGWDGDGYIFVRKIKKKISYGF